MSTVHLILYVAGQARSSAFYRQALDRTPRLDVPGMTEFELGGGAVLGLMPVTGIRQLLGPKLPDPSASETPRAELYLRVADPEAAHARALAAGGRELSPVRPRNWGDRAGYVLDPDQHVLAFASLPASSPEDEA